MKKIYHKPTMTALSINNFEIICVSTESNVGIGGGNSVSTGVARVKGQVNDSEWDEWDDWSE